MPTTMAADGTIAAEAAATATMPTSQPGRVWPARVKATAFAGEPGFTSRIPANPTITGMPSAIW